MIAGDRLCASMAESGMLREPQAGDIDVLLKGTLACMLTSDIYWTGLTQIWHRTNVLLGQINQINTYKKCYLF